MTRSNFRPKISHAFLRNYRSRVLKFNYNSQRRDTASSASLHPPSFSRSHLALTVSGISGYSAFVNPYGRKLSIPQNVIFRRDGRAKQNRPRIAMRTNYIFYVFSPLLFLFLSKIFNKKKGPLARRKILLYARDQGPDSQSRMKIDFCIRKWRCTITI